MAAPVAAMRAALGAATREVAAVATRAAAAGAAATASVPETGEPCLCRIHLIF